MGTILYTPVDVGNGYWKMELDQKKVNEFILKAMRKILEKGVVYLNADPPKRPSDMYIIRYAPGMGGEAKCYGFHVDLKLETGRLMIALVYDEYRKSTPDENKCYMAIREDIERIISLFSNVDM